MSSYVGLPSGLSCLKLRPPVVDTIETLLFEGLTYSVIMGGFETLSDMLTLEMLTVLLGIRVASES